MRKMIYGLALIVFTLSISYGKANAAEALGFDVSGFVDASYFVDDNADSNTFGLDQVEIDIEKEIKDWASVRLDLQHCPSGSQASCARVCTKLTWDAIRLMPTDTFEKVYDIKID